MGEGERREAMRRRRERMVVVASLGVAVAIVAGTWLFKRPGGAVAPGWAVAFTLIYVGVLAGCWAFARRFADEVELRTGKAALATAALAQLFLFPPWFFLGSAGLVPAPDAETLYLASIGMILLAFIWRKFR